MSVLEGMCYREMSLKDVMMIMIDWMVMIKVGEVKIIGESDEMMAEGSDRHWQSCTFAITWCLLKNINFKFSLFLYKALYVQHR